MPTTILANWKANKTHSEALHWFETFLDCYAPRKYLEIIIAPPSLYLDSLGQLLKKKNRPEIALAAQDISPFPLGSYTGATPARMLKDFCRYTIVGHSERRHYFNESHSDNARKITEAQSEGITPILCLDMNYASAQIAALDQKALDGNLIIGYGPVHNVNLNIPQDPKAQQENILALQHLVANLPILYGGSVRPENSNGYLELEAVSGLMVGSSSLNPGEFAKICSNVPLSSSHNQC